jgi:hypothetical protein
MVKLKICKVVQEEKRIISNRRRAIVVPWNNFLPSFKDTFSSNYRWNVGFNSKLLLKWNIINYTILQTIQMCASYQLRMCASYLYQESVFKIFRQIYNLYWIWNFGHKMLNLLVTHIVDRKQGGRALQNKIDILRKVPFNNTFSMQISR